MKSEKIKFLKFKEWLKVKILKMKQIIEFEVSKESVVKIELDLEYLSSYMKEIGVEKIPYQIFLDERPAQIVGFSFSDRPGRLHWM